MGKTKPLTDNKRNDTSGLVHKHFKKISLDKFGYIIRIGTQTFQKISLDKFEKTSSISGINPQNRPV